MTYQYSADDTARFAPEGPKGSLFGGTEADHRSVFSRDRARVLHSAALRRLADKTQVVGPQDGDTPRTRLTHSLEVGQIARGIGAGLGLDPDLCDMAGLTHDIGHPPYGHNGEVALNALAADAGGFEGNAQTLRILTRLEPKVLYDDHSYGLNLTRAALDAACKYPWAATNADGTKNRKYSAYDEDAHILEWVRKGHTDRRASMEAQVMDFSDDIAYSVHDVEDGIISGRVTLAVLWDLVELAALAEKGAAAFGGTAEELLEAADRLRALPIVQAGADYDYTLRGWVALKKLTSELVGRYVGSVVTATVESSQGTLGRMYGDLIVPHAAEAEVRLLKTTAVLYVMDMPAHLKRQDRQRDRINRVHDYLVAGAPGTLDTMYQGWWEEAETSQQKARVIIDQIASMTESRLERIAQRSAGFTAFMG